MQFRDGAGTTVDLSQDLIVLAWYGKVTVFSDVYHQPVSRMWEPSSDSKTFLGNDKCQETASLHSRLLHGHNWVDKLGVEASTSGDAQSYTCSLTSWSQTI